MGISLYFGNMNVFDHNVFQKSKMIINHGPIFSFI